MIIQLIDIFYLNVFKRYSTKYNIFRELYERDLLGLEIRDIEYKLAQRIKKIIFSNKEICYSTPKRENGLVDVMSLGSYAIFKELAKEIIAIGNEDLGFKIKKVIQNISEYEYSSFAISDHNYNLNKCYIMGILNVTPDSFSDGGKFYNKENAIQYGIELIDDGADILDIGGESSRPEAKPISEQEELDRVIPVVEEIIKRRTNAVLSIDTTKSKVAYEVLKRGVKIVNDISAFTFDNKILDVVKQFNSTIVLMHMKDNPRTMQNNPLYEDVVSDIYNYLIAKIAIANKRGIKNIIVDPGIGFGKTVLDNYELLKRLNEFKGIGQPIMVGLSRKSFLGKALDLKVDERENPTLVAESIAIKNGARIIRTHNVKNAKYASLINSFIENPDILMNV